MWFRSPSSKWDSTLITLCKSVNIIFGNATLKKNTHKLWTFFVEFNNFYYKTLSLGILIFRVEIRQIGSGYSTFSALYSTIISFLPHKNVCLNYSDIKQLKRLLIYFFRFPVTVAMAFGSNVSKRIELYNALETYSSPDKNIEVCRDCWIHSPFYDPLLLMGDIAIINLPQTVEFTTTIQPVK